MTKQSNKPERNDRTDGKWWVRPNNSKQKTLRTHRTGR